MTSLGISSNTTAANLSTSWRGRCRRPCCDVAGTSHPLLRPSHRNLLSEGVRPAGHRRPGQPDAVGNGAVVSVNYKTRIIETMKEAEIIKATIRSLGYEVKELFDESFEAKPNEWTVVFLRKKKK